MLVVSTASVLQLLIQFAITGVTASYYGATLPTDALAAALALPTFASAVVTGSLSYILIPDLVAKFENVETHQEGWRLATFVALVTGVLGAMISGALYFAAKPITLAFYPEMSAESQVLTQQCLEILSIQVVLTGLVSWAIAIHHSRHSFFWPALGGVVGTACSLAFAIYAGSSSITAIAWAINLGSVVSIAVQAIPLAPSLGRPQADYGNVLRLLRVFWPLLLGTMYLRIEPLVDRMLADSLNDEGAISHINYSQRIMMALLSLGTSSLALIAFPQLAARYADQGLSAFREHFSLALRRLWLLIVPIAVGVSCFSVQIVSDLLERDQFTADDSATVGWLVFATMGMFVGASLGELTARAFFVLEDTLTPTVVGVVTLTVGLLIKLALVEHWGIWAIALGVSSYFLLSASTTLWLLYRRLGGAIFKGSSVNIRDAGIASLVACGMCFCVYATRMGGTWIAAPVGAVVYFSILLLIKNEQAWQIPQEIAARLRGK
ncbi:MAG: hypothetical protein Aurels2KO_27570 [Aureliella sp.]